MEWEQKATTQNAVNALRVTQSTIIIRIRKNQIRVNK
jgi:hypothetical protein